MSKFKEGDKVEVFDDGSTSKAWVGVQGIVRVVKPYGGYKVELTETARTGEQVGYLANLWGNNLKLVEEAKRQFKPGDKVEVIEDHYGGQIGEQRVVRGLDNPEDGPGAILYFEGDPTNKKAAYARRFKLVEEQPFTFKDIQVGDTIRRTLIREGGTKEVREGTVSKLGWCAEANGYILAYDGDTADAKDVTLELLNRPEPVKEAWETAKAGDRLVVKSESGLTRILTKQEDGEWGSLMVNSSGNVSAGVTRTESSIKNQLDYPPFNVGTPQFIPA